MYFQAVSLIELAGLVILSLFIIADLVFTGWAIRRIWPYDGNHSVLIVAFFGLMFACWPGALIQSFFVDLDHGTVVGPLLMFFLGVGGHITFTLPQLLRADHLRRRELNETTQ